MLLGMENGGLSPLSADSHNLKVALEAAESIVCCCNGKVESSGTLPGIYSDIQSGAELYFSTPSADESKRCAYVVKAHEVSGDLKLPSPDGSFLNAKWIFEEVTERILLGICTARLLQLASVALLTGQYAHDFNNLIGAADGAVSLLQRNVGSDDKLVRRVSLIAESLSRSTALSQDLGLLVQKEDRNLQVMSASNLARFLEEGLSEQLLYSKVDCGGLNCNEKP
ncbi:MAG: hypothetical protein KDD70_10355, partial [Bdellovibrionales bacterium]|nr:hypothetical protein [Bdellovibrionales bacterium]